MFQHWVVGRICWNCFPHMEKLRSKFDHSQANECMKKKTVDKGHYVFSIRFTNYNKFLKSFLYILILSLFVMQKCFAPWFILIVTGELDSKHIMNFMSLNHESYCLFVDFFLLSSLIVCLFSSLFRCKPMDAEDCEPFTDVYWIKFRLFSNARFRKLNTSCQSLVKLQHFRIRSSY